MHSQTKLEGEWRIWRGQEGTKELCYKSFITQLDLFIPYYCSSTVGFFFVASIFVSLY